MSCQIWMSRIHKLTCCLLNIPIPKSTIRNMFLYLSKLLPLFFYPLGLASVSLIVALVTLWKRPRIAT